MSNVSLFSFASNPSEPIEQWGVPCVSSRIPHGVPELPKDTTARGWVAWVNQHFPFSAEAEAGLLKRTGPTERLDASQLRELCGVRCRVTAACLARLWLQMWDKQGETIKQHEEQRAAEEERKRAKIVVLARAALAGELGKNKRERDSARATAVEFLGSTDPGERVLWELEDWQRMHGYQREIRSGRYAKRPVLHRDLQARRKFNDAVSDIDEGIGSIRYEPQRQQELLLEEEHNPWGNDP